MTALPLNADPSNPAIAYERLLVDPLFRPWAVLLVDLTAVSPGMRVLDMGCGTGIVARIAAERGARVTGVDQSRGMLDVARQLEPTIDWREGSAGNPPLAMEETFDVVLSGHALQFFPDRAVAVRQMHRALVRGGRLGLTTWSPLRDGFLRDLHLVAEQRLGPVTDRRHAFGEEGPVKELLQNSGFEEVVTQTQTRRVTFTDPAAFLQLNSRAMVGMSPRTASLSDASKRQLIGQLVLDSADAARMHTTADGLTFSIGSLIATARR